jgi:sterol 3beta-glucosyltransferase
MSAHRFCFRSLIYGVRTKLVIPFREVANVEMQRGFRLGYSGIVLVIHGHEELFFEFRTENARNDCAGTIFRKLDYKQAVADSTVLLTEQQQHEAEGAAAENRLLQAARKDRPESALLDVPDDDDATGVLSDDPTASLVDLPSPPSMLVTCLTIGSRGDVQPYIALCKGLMAQGHRTRIATHGEFRGWVESHGIEFAEVAGDPAELMRVCVENGMFTIPFFIEANSKFRSWLDGLLLTAWEACQGSDLVIESPSAMCGIHIAEALGVPYFRAFTMPWTRTRAYPHAFAVRNAKMGGAYNYMTYTLFDNVFWTWTEGQINSWRVKTLGIRPTNLDKLQQNKVPFLYNFSPSVVPPPLDFSDWVKVTGYWFLNEGSDYQPPEDLAAFIKKARDDGMKLVYIGFGSVVVNDSRKLTEQIVNAVQKADVRCILSKGWSDRFDKKDANVPDIVLPSCIHAIRSAPHDWLFTQIDAVVHHGGAGTTGASLRAGKPTIIKPFFGDQYFFATRVEDLGVGIHLSKATEHQLGKALWTAVHDDRMQTKARLLGEAIRAQDGVQTAIRAIYSDLDYARSLIKQKTQTAQQAASSKAGASASTQTKDAAITQAPALDLHDEDTEENWTFVDVSAHDDAATGAAGLELDRLAASTPPPILQQQQQQTTTLKRGLSNLRLAPSLLGRR